MAGHIIRYWAIDGVNTREYSQITSTHTRLSGDTREYSSLVSGTSTRRVLVVAYSLSASVHSADSTSTRHSRVTLVPLSDPHSRNWFAITVGRQVGVVDGWYVYTVHHRIVTLTSNYPVGISVPREHQK